MDHDAQNLIDACADAQANGEPLPAAVDAATSILVDAGATSIQRLTAPAFPADQDRQNAMRDQEGETEVHELYAIECELASEAAIQAAALEQKHTVSHSDDMNDKALNGLAEEEPSPGAMEQVVEILESARFKHTDEDIPGATYSLLASAFATAITEAEQAARAEVLAEAARAAAGEFPNRSGLYAEGSAYLAGRRDARSDVLGLAKSAKPSQQVPPQRAMDRAQEVVDRFPAPEEFDAKICLVEEVAAALEAARAKAFAEAEAIVEWGQETHSTETEYPFLTARKHGNSAGLAYARAIRALAAAKPPQPQKPEE